MAYVVKAESRAHLVESHLPFPARLKGGREVALHLLSEPYDDKDLVALKGIFAEVIEEGVSYPQDGEVTLESFKAYYLSHDVFVLRDAASGDILGAFYIKPNFPGRCSHICNHGFLVPSHGRGLGVGTVMAKLSLPLTKALGYNAVYYNLVFTDNVHAIHMYRKLGFQQTGFVPKAARLKDGSYQDAVQLHFDLDKLDYELRDLALDRA